MTDNRGFRLLKKLYDLEVEGHDASKSTLEEVRNYLNKANEQKEKFKDLFPILLCIIGGILIFLSFLM